MSIPTSGFSSYQAKVPRNFLFDVLLSLPISQPLSKSCGLYCSSIIPLLGLIVFSIATAIVQVTIILLCPLYCNSTLPSLSGRITSCIKLCSGPADSTLSASPSSPHSSCCILCHSHPGQISPLFWLPEYNKFYPLSESLHFFLFV